MLMPKKDRVAIYEYVFKEGVCVAKKDFHLPKHHQIEVKNLHVIKAMQSLVSRGFAKEQFAWRHYYWTLTSEGIAYLREFLHLPAEIVPATLKRSQRPQEPGRPEGRGPGAGRGFGGGEGGGYGRRPYGDRDTDRDQYRRGPGGFGDKTADAGPGSGQMEFRGGFGRGKPAPL